MTHDLLTIPIPVAGLTFKRIDRQVLVHDARADAIHVLNGSAGRVLELADGTRATEAIAVAFAREFAIDLERARTDVAGALGEFMRLGLVSETAAPAE